jgi:glycosyltransferase involved in cell wall biosynthesis
MYGAGLMKESFIHEIEGQDLGILIHEPDANIVERYLESSIHLLPSVYEPFGLVIVEAMSCGLPVVSFDCPYGPANIIIDGKDGFLIKDRNIEKFAEKLCLLIENPELRKSMGQVGIVSSQRYDASQIMPKWKALFEQMAFCLLLRPQ